MNELFFYKVYQYLFWKAAENVYFSKLIMLKVYGIKFNFMKLSDMFAKKPGAQNEFGRYLIL